MSWNRGGSWLNTPVYPTFNFFFYISTNTNPWILNLCNKKKSTTMPPPSALSIKTSSVIRLIKEEASYHKEAVAQEKVIEKLENEGGDEYELRQQVRLPR